MEIATFVVGMKTCLCGDAFEWRLFFFDVRVEQFGTMGRVSMLVPLI